MRKITPFLWFNDQAEEAAKFYAEVFSDSKIGNVARYDEAAAAVSGKPEGSAMTVSFRLEGQDFVGLNGGPLFTFNPSISFYVQCETEDEVDSLWRKLSQGGATLMDLGKYDWSEKYGWIADKYGVSWQVSLGRLSDVGQKITPVLLFVGKQHGKAEKALNLYTSVFKESDVDGILRYGAEDGSEKEGTVKHAQFSLAGNKFMVMDGGLNHQFSFNESISFMVHCGTQEEVDYYWAKLTADGGQESMCGWLKDRFGVSWQIIPEVLPRLLGDPDRVKAARAMGAMLQMKKINIKNLEQAYGGFPGKVRQL